MNGRHPDALMQAAAPIVVAALLDLIANQPPSRVHPVRGLGRLLEALATLVPSQPGAVARRRGATAWLTGLLATFAAGTAIDATAHRLRPWPAALVRGVALWPMMSLRMLIDEVRAVEDALAHDVSAGREKVGRLVSRPVEELDTVEVRGAAISSLAENLVDSWTAPLLFFAFAGLPGAAAYRYVNTADAMWGHRDPRWMHAGFAAARADDLAGHVPARVTAHMLVASGRRWRLASEAARTVSPNGGWPMSAVALSHGIRLDKPGVYVLNPSGRTPQPQDTAAAIRRVRWCGWWFVALAAALRALVGSWRLLGSWRLRCRH